MPDIFDAALDTDPTCTKIRNGTCLQRLAGGWIFPEDLCPDCTCRFMAGLDEISGRPLQWHPAFVERSRRD